LKELDRFGRVVRFTDFEVDLRTGELRKRGMRVRLPEQPFQILTMLLERPGELVTRDELQKKLWPAGTFVELDLSLNAAIKKLRQALGDDALSPRYIQTLPRRGYRFIAPVDGATAGAAQLIRAELDAEMGRRGLPSRRPSSPCEAVPAQRSSGNLCVNRRPLGERMKLQRYSMVCETYTKQR
jgi:DNA-binding winged helix-turn-helix (wHTH) protein